MQKNYFNHYSLTLVAVLAFLSNVALAQENNNSDSIPKLAYYNSNPSKTGNISSHNEEIIKEKKSNSTVKNSLTKREITIKNEKTSFKFKYGARIQTRFDVSRLQESSASTENELYFRRVRIKSDGHLFTPKLGYKIEIDVIGAQILDAVLQWNFYKNFVLWGGQTKLRGNRERVISSQNLQFVDRSLLNSKFTLDRDIGVWLMHHFQAGNGVIREAVSVSKGEGMSIFQENPMPVEKGLDYSARLEYLPFGIFTNKGDYKGSDLEREPMPKLSVGLTFDYNENAVKSRGQKGSVTDNEADLRSWIADAMFKYRGFSVMTEYVDRSVYNFSNQSVEQYHDYVNDFYTGTAFNAQSGYLFKKNYELAARYTQVRPQEGSSFTDITEYTFALSKYIVGHSIKVQTDFSFRYEQDKPVTHIYRLQFELSL
jgi:phosphate-selective porin OprO/OprP